MQDFGRSWEQYWLINEKISIMCPEVDGLNPNFIEKQICYGSITRLAILVSNWVWLIGSNGLVDGN